MRAVKISVFCIPAFGHLNPIIAAAKELTDRGCDVTFYASPFHKEAAEKTGADVKIVQTPYDGRINELAKYSGKRLFTVARTALEYAEAVLDRTFDEIKENPPDIILHDVMTVNARAACRILKIPSAVIVPVFALEERKIPKAAARMIEVPVHNMIPSISEIIGFFGAVRSISSKYGIKKRDIQWVFNDYGDVNIITTSREFQYSSHRFPEERFKFTGPLLFEGREKPADFSVDKKKKTVLVSLGTLYNHNSDFYEKCIKAFAGTDYNVVMSVNDEKILNIAQNAGKNFYARKYVPQLQVLKYADVFVTHAGMNSVNEALYNGVPLVCAPQALDQFMNADRVRQLGAGVVLKKTSPEKIRNAVEMMLSEPSFKKRAAEIGKGLKKGGGVKRAADEIMRVRKGGESERQ